MDVAIVLILITFASTVVATLWEGHRRAKLIIIGLAAVSSGAAIYQTWENYEAARTTRNILENLAQAVRPPEIFEAAMLDAVRQIAKEEQTWVSSQIVSEDGGRVFGFGTSSGGEPDAAGYAHVSPRAVEEAFLAFVHREPIAAALESHPFRVWHRDDPDGLDEQLALSVKEIAEVAFNELLPWTSEQTVFEGRFNYDAPDAEVVARDPWSGSTASVRFDAGFFDEVSGIPAIQRGRRIYDTAAEQITAQLGQ